MFGPGDHRSHRRREWLEQGLRKLAQLDFLTEDLSSTIGQTAIKFALSGAQVASVLPNITSAAQLEEFALAPESEDVPSEYVDRLWDLFDEGFMVEEQAAEPTAAG